MAQILDLPIPETARKQVLKQNYERAREAFNAHKLNSIDAYSQAEYIRLHGLMQRALAAMNGLE